MKAKLSLAILATLLGSLSFAEARDFQIRKPSQVKDIVKSVKPGDSIIFAPGRWKDVDIKLSGLTGTPSAPITVRAQSPGKTILVGSSTFRFSGQHVLVKDFVFRDLAKASDAVQFRSDSKTLASHCRLTQCVFDQPNLNTTGKQSTHWLAIFGANNRVDHCYFGGKSNLGTTLVVRVTETPGHHRIDHNHFGPRPELGENGGETIRVGTSGVSEFDSMTVVEDNYFEACDGEIEIISNKSCRNTYRRNVFDSCAGTLTLRHGHRCLVEKNVFLGRRKKHTGGVRVIGSDHMVQNNYFEGLTGTAARAALCLYCGIKNSPLNGYAPVQRAKLLNNTVIDCDSSLEIGAGEETGRQIYPKDCLIAANLFKTSGAAILRKATDLSTIRFVDNVNASLNSPLRDDEPLKCRQVRVQWKRDEMGLMRPVTSEQLRATGATAVTEDIDGNQRPLRDATIGCDEPGGRHQTFVTKDVVGPSWNE